MNETPFPFGLRTALYSGNHRLRMSFTSRELSWVLNSAGEREMLAVSMMEWRESSSRFQTLLYTFQMVLSTIFTKMGDCTSVGFHVETFFVLGLKM